jgi:hypothetical protein
MRLAIGVMAATLALGGVARAQGSAAAEKGYIEAVGQSAFGNVTSQNFGVEAGVTVMPRLQVFVEAGKTRDVSPKELGQAAQVIAGYLSQTQSNVAFTVKQPATIFAAGLRYSIVPAGGTPGRVRPYVMGGAGIARTSKNVAFTIGGSDVTTTLSQYGVVLGTDLTGDATSTMIVAGGGAMITLYKQLVFDVQLRFGRILAEDQGITLGRVGGGIGFTF